MTVRAEGLSGSRIAEAGERVGVRVPSGPRFGADGAFEGFVRLPRTAGGEAPRTVRRPRGAGAAPGSGQPAGAFSRSTLRNARIQAG